MQQSLVEGVDVIHHFFDGKVFAHEFSAFVAEALAQGGIAGEASEAFAESGEVMFGDEVAGAVVQADFGGAVAIVSDDRQCGREGLGNSAGQAFAVRKVNEGIGGAEPLGNFAYRDEAGKDKAAFEFRRGGAGFKFWAPGAVAKVQKF